MILKALRTASDLRQSNVRVKKALDRTVSNDDSSISGGHGLTCVNAVINLLNDSQRQGKHSRLTEKDEARAKSALIYSSSACMNYMELFVGPRPVKMLACLLANTRTAEHTDLPR